MLILNPRREPLLHLPGQVLNSQTYVQNQTIVFSPQTFAAICTAAAAGGVTINNDCTGAGYPITIRLNVVVDIDGNNQYTGGSTTEDAGSITLVIASVVDSEFASAVGTIGLYQFVTFPGDQKIRLKSVVAEEPFPQTMNGGTGIAAVRVYFQAGPDPCVEPGTAGFTGLVPTTPGGYRDISVADATGLLSTYSVLELENGIRYYFKVALIDNAGNIAFKTPTADDSCSHTAKPDEVIGLLSEKSGCFIATAAFGSEMMPQVRILRDFRDSVLLKSEPGRRFVNWYYKYSPAWADQIRTNESAKEIVRWSLYPLVGFSWVAVHWGASNASLLAALILLLPLLIFRWNRTQKIVRRT
jgi:hypothetical protein